MREESENSTQSQAKIESIVDEIESIKARFNKKAKFKSKVDVVGTVQKARRIFCLRWLKKQNGKLCCFKCKSR